MRLFLLGIALFLSVQLLAQSGQIAGEVRDAKTEEALIGVTILIEGTSDGATTDINGKYLIAGLEPGSYNLTASYVGYESKTTYNVVVKSGGNPNVNFELSETVEELEGVTVTANPFEKSMETPLSIQKLSQEEVATYPGGNNDIAKVVQSLPGVSGSVGGFRNDVIIRGGAPNENVYYLDGIEIPNINHFATQGSAGGPVGLLNVSFFEGVTLSTSAFESQYDNALSGVLQFDQRNGNDQELKTNLRVSGSETALTMEGPLFKGEKEAANTTFIASVRRSYLQFLFQLIDLPFLPDYWDYQYKISHKFSKYDELIVTGVGSIDDLTINAPDDFSPEQQATLDQIPIIQQNTFTSGVSWKHRFKDFSGYTQTTLSTNILQNKFQQYENNVDQTGLYLNNDSREWETKLRHNYTRFAGDWTFAAGGTVQLADYSNITTDVVNDFQYDIGYSFIKYGVNGQASRDFLNGALSFSAGFRVDGNTFTDSGHDIWRTFSPRVSASYKLDEAQKWSLNASLGRYYKLPPYTILGFTDSLGSFANRSAEYIRSDHAVLGLEYLLTKSSRISVEGFYKKYGNYPVSLVDSVSLANLGGGFEVLGNEPIASVGLGRTYGVELLYQQKFTGKLYGILAITLYKSEYTGFDEDEYLPSVWDNGQLITFTGGYKFGNNWELGLRTRYLGRTPFAPVDRQATLDNYPAIIKDYSQLGTVSLDPFFQADVRIDKKFNFKNWTLDIFLDVQNVLASNLPSEPSYGLDRNEQGEIVEPRNLIRIQEVDNSSVLPTLGIVVDF
ncbi:TonB-dependent receptor [Marinoscillum sp.]|uniref:TonB-dependent receptor n=1 Tax=Marinoscillum sp. TaxID=2024838 RepID=UPI003BAAF7EC